MKTFFALHHSCDIFFHGTYEVPTTVTRKYAYANDLAIKHADGDWQSVEGVLSKDMATAGEYLQTWQLKFNTTNTVSAAFNLNNKEAKRELKLNLNNETLPFCSGSKRVLAEIVQDDLSSYAVLKRNFHL